MESHFAEIIKEIEKLLQIQVTATTIPPQGMDSDVFLIKDHENKEYAIKCSRNGMNEVNVLQHIYNQEINIPIPKMFGNFSFEEKTVIIFEKINFPLLEEIPAEKRYLYIPSMIKNLQKIHTITSDTCGRLSDENQTLSWKELVLHRYSGNHPEFNWNEVMQRNGVDKELIQQSIINILKQIEHQNFLTHSYSLLHTDFNQRNLFMNPEKHEVAAIIDWGEAMFGDPLYDFARVRMYMWHFSLGKKTLDNYYQMLQLTEAEKKLEELYFVDQILHYIAWYSEVDDEFNKGRLTKHQTFLNEYSWR
jgi:thiamine kinase-like enzyme